METFDNKNLYKKPRNDKATTNLLIIGFNILGLLVGFTFGYLVKTLTSNNNSNPLISKMDACYSVLKDYWYYGNSEDAINEAVAELMLTSQSSVDPYTFITASQEDQNLSLDTKGFGFQLVSVPDGFLIERAFPSGALYKAGARDGDIITSLTISGTEYDFKDKTYSERQSYMNTAKTAGRASFSLLSGSEEKTLLNVSTSNFTQESAYILDDFTNSSTLTIKLDSFLGDGGNSPSTLVSAFTASKSFDTLVIDMRDNGGGYLDEVTKIANLFTPKDKYNYFAKNRDNQIIAYSRQEDNPRFTDKTIKIIQNGMSASASESLALALKQNNNAEIYGFTSYGKGIAQTFHTFDDNSVLRFTYAKMFGPDGINSIHGTGIVPDVNSSTLGIKEYPYSYSSYILTANNYSQNLPILDSFLTYLGYDLNENNVIETINEFQTDFGYETSSSYSEEVTQQLHYEIYKEVQEQSILELSKVTNIAVS